MEKYVLIDMFEKLDASLLEELHLEKDLKRHKKTIRRLFAWTCKNCQYYSRG